VEGGECADSSKREKQSSTTSFPHFPVLRAKSDSLAAPLVVPVPLHRRSENDNGLGMPLESFP
jgi:hypothetical protein